MLPLKEDLTLIPDPALAGEPGHPLRWVIAGVVVALLVGIILWQRRRRPAAQPSTAPTPVPENPHDWLRRARDELAKGEAITAVASADHALRLSLESELGKPCTSLTTRELAAAIAEQTASALAPLITDFFEPADLLRFSGMTPSLPRAVDLVAFAAHHVETLRPAPPQGTT